MYTFKKTLFKTIELFKFHKLIIVVGKISVTVAMETFPYTCDKIISCIEILRLDLK